MLHGKLGISSKLAENLGSFLDKLLIPLEMDVKMG